MAQRCTNPNHKQFKDYGGRGIRVCERWRRYDNFLADMGRRPDNRHWLERIDNDGDYEPGNCRWATTKEQSRNKRSNRIVTAFGKTAPLVRFAGEDCYSRTYRRIEARIRRGWPIERAISVPPLREVP